MEPGEERGRGEGGRDGGDGEDGKRWEWVGEEEVVIMDWILR